ncbi:hypothetical protein BLS_007384 [Venturia inaequalis]|uniref:Uncharacterized protein n=1 Tax=Venturia inaequalis TaxID=5025 RepID=A0A8H3UAI0_VENIN|nr:hypothetical protein BLS_007384 [Venturia inaequalis]
MDNSRPHLTSDNSAVIDGEGKGKKRRDRMVVENGVVYEIIPDAGEAWYEEEDGDEDEGDLEADFYPEGSKARGDVRNGVVRRKVRRKLRDARLDEPRTAEFTMTKFDGFARRMEGVRGEAQVNRLKEVAAAAATERKKKKKKVEGKGKPGFGTPIRDYTTYHASTVALLKTDAEALDSLYSAYKLKRRTLGSSTSEKSSMVDLKAGNTLERMVEDMITPGPEEIGEQTFREVEADMEIERDEERGWDEEIERNRGRVGVEKWGGRNWGRRGCN